MAKTSYKQTVKGTKTGASASHARQAALLGKLISARKKGLSNLNGQLANAKARNKATRVSTVKDLIGGFSTAQAGYDRSEKDAEGAVSTTVGGSRLNRAREGMDAMAEMSGMQAGETDRIRGMAAALRGMQTNIGGGLNDYGNAMTSINNSLGDLNTSTSTNINNALREQNTSDSAAFGEYTSGRQQAYADLVDLYGQRGAAYEAYADATSNKVSNMKSSGTKNVKATQTDVTKHTKTSKKAVKGAKGAFAGSAWAANQLAAEMGKKFTEQVLTIDQMNAESTDPTQQFHAAAMRENRSNLDELANAGTLRKMAAPEGSKLRKREVA